MMKSMGRQCSIGRIEVGHEADFPRLSCCRGLNRRDDRPSSDESGVYQCLKVIGRGAARPNVTRPDEFDEGIAAKIVTVECPIANAQSSARARRYSVGYHLI